jgi:hypothetical protein
MVAESGIPWRAGGPGLRVGHDGTPGPSPTARRRHLPCDAGRSGRMRLPLAAGRRPLAAAPPAALAALAAPYEPARTGSGPSRRTRSGRPDTSRPEPGRVRCAGRDPPNPRSTAGRAPAGTVGPVTMEGPERQTGVSRSAARGQPSTDASAALPGGARRFDWPVTRKRTPGVTRSAVCEVLPPHQPLRRLSVDPHGSRIPRTRSSELEPLSNVPSARTAVLDVVMMRNAKPHVKGYFAIPRVVPRHS